MVFLKNQLRRFSAHSKFAEKFLEFQNAFSESCLISLAKRFLESRQAGSPGVFEKYFQSAMSFFGKFHETFPGTFFSMFDGTVPLEFHRIFLKGDSEMFNHIFRNILRAFTMIFSDIFQNFSLHVSCDFRMEKSAFFYCRGYPSRNR